MRSKHGENKNGNSSFLPSLFIFNDKIVFSLGLKTDKCRRLYCDLLLHP